MKPLARGRLLKTKKKEMEALGYSMEKGRLKAKYKMIQKQPWGVIIKEYAGEMVKKIDPLKLTATIALTPLVKATLDTTPELLSLYQKLLIIGSPILGFLFTTQVDPQDIKINELYSWIVSFGLAYIVVEHFGEIASAGQSIGGWIAGLIA